MPVPTGLTLSESIDLRITRVPECACWVWTGAMTPKGYGCFTFHGRTYVVHRYVYEHEVGPIPPGLVLDHVRARGCITRLCCNPAHLEPVTSRVNVLRGDGRAARQAAQTHCLRGHPLSGPGADVYVQRGTNRRQCRACRR